LRLTREGDARSGRRLEKVFEIIEEPARGKRCHAIEGLVDEGKEIMKDFRGSPALDAGLLAAAQAVEHYEISRYGTLKTWAEKLGMQQAVMLLNQEAQAAGWLRLATRPSRNSPFQFQRRGPAIQAVPLSW
jgi:ferritin-like metal-binding protein YciE